MSKITIGNWKVTDEGIEHTTDEDVFIPKENLLEKGIAERANSYDWLIHLAGKTWLSVEDIYALNTAYIYAIDYFELDFNKVSFVDTIKIQQAILRDK